MLLRLTSRSKVELSSIRKILFEKTHPKQISVIYEFSQNVGARMMSVMESVLPHVDTYIAILTMLKNIVTRSACLFPSSYFIRELHGYIDTVVPGSLQQNLS